MPDPKVIELPMHAIFIFGAFAIPGKLNSTKPIMKIVLLMSKYLRCEGNEISVFVILAGN